MFNVFTDLLGWTMKDVRKVGCDQLIFEREDGRVFQFYHAQNCCEFVSIDDICGDLNDLVGSPLTMAEEVSSEGVGAKNKDGYTESFTWTFYRFATAKGHVDVKWYGTSNGYYSESVDFGEVV